jgi:hypothetical protein
MDNCLGDTSGTRRVTNQDGLVEIDANDGGRFGTSLPQEVIQLLGARNMGNVQGLLESPYRNNTLEQIAVLHASLNVGHLVAEVDPATIIQRGVVHEDEPRVDLHRPLQDARDAHVGRAAAEDGAHPARRQQHGERLDAVGSDDDDAVAPPDTGRVQGRGEPGGRLTQRSPCHIAQLADALPHLGQRHLVILLPGRAVEI